MNQVTDLSDPRRCKGRAPDGQCRNVSVTGSDYCLAHGGHDLTDMRKQQGFLLAKAEDQGRLSALSDTLEPVKELRSTIALTHMLIEKRWNSVKDDTDLLTHCGPLNQMIATMEKLVSSCHRIETNLGELLARQAIIALAKDMVQIVIEELEGIDDYELIIDRITERLINTIRDADNSPKEAPLQLPEIPK